VSHTGRPQQDRTGIATRCTTLREALHAEWTKTRTTPTTMWLLGAVTTLTVTLGVAADAAASCPTGGCPLDPARTSLTGLYLGQAAVAVLAVLAISGEYNTTMIRLTFTAVPRRGTVLAAKAITLASLVIAASAVAVMVSLLAGWLILSAHGFTPAHGYPPLSPGNASVLRAAAGSVLYLTLIAVLSLGIATAVREAATGIGIVLGLLYLIPILAAAVPDPHWQHHLQQIAPMTAGLAIQATTGLRHLPISPLAGLGVLTAWASAALLTGGLLLHRRDA
jgi:ABC-2 type transport system permease protein